MRLLLPLRPYSLLVVLILVFSNIIYGQIHVEKQKSFELKTGLVDGVKPINHFIQINLIKYKRRQLFTSIGLQYQSKKYHHELLLNKRIDVELLLLTSSVGYGVPLNSSKTMWLNTSLQAHAGYEFVNRDKFLISQTLTIYNRSKPIVGLSINPEIEVYLSQRYSLGIYTKLFWNPLSTVQAMYSQNGLSLKYHFF